MFDLTPLHTYLAQVAPQGRTMLLPALHYAQTLFGWLPTEALLAISKGLRVPSAEVHGVVEFYSLFYDRPVGKQMVRLCTDPACSLLGAREIDQAITALTGLSGGQNSADLTRGYETVTCLGLCEHAPCALDGDHPVGSLTSADLPQLWQKTLPAVQARPFGEVRWLLARVGVVDPLSLADYQAHGGYRVLPSLLEQSAEQVLDQVEALGIVGRGGAMFPLGRKWRATRQAQGGSAEKQIVANADESEPGTFKDRALLEEDPFSLIEAMTIASYAIGAENGWIFVRGEYPRSAQRLANAIAQARSAGLLGRDILGKNGFHFDITLRVGAGAYICGEETALFEAIEGKRGFPRIKPPFPVTQGLFGKPTAINNVETLCAMLAGLAVGVEAWRSVGTAQSYGTKLFCLSGHIAQPGVYEVPFGLTLGQLIEMAGGVRSGLPVQGVLLGGAAGVFVDERQFDVVLSYEGARQAQLPLGSGVVMVFDQSADLRQHLAELARFFAHESCGKCFPCQLGSQRQWEIWERIAQNGKGSADDRQCLHDLGVTMSQTSLCGLGQTAATASLSALALWPQLVEGQP